MEGGTTSGVIGRARRHCGAAGEKKRAELWLRIGTGKREPSHFPAPVPGSQFLPSFSMPATPQAQIPVRSGCVELKRSRSGSAGGGSA